MWESTDLLRSVKNRAMLPDSGAPLSDANILEFATEEMHATVLPLVMSMRSDYGVVRTSTPIVVGQAEYRIPDRAIGGKLRFLKRINTSAAETDVPLYSSEQTQELRSGGAYIEGDSIFLTPTPTEGGTLVMGFYVRPGLLDERENCASTVTAINLTTGTSVSVEVDTTDGLGDLVDIYSGVPNFGYKAVGVGTDWVAGFSLTLTGANLRIAVGDVLSPPNFTCIPNVPAEAHSWLAQLTVCRVLEALGDKSALETATMKATALERSLVSLLAPRNEGDAKVMVNRAVLGV
jgi:hypothetical protein